MTLQEIVTVEFAVILGAMGQVMVRFSEYPMWGVVSDKEMAPAKLLRLVREIDMEPMLPKLMFIGAMLMAKSPTWTVD